MILFLSFRIKQDGFAWICNKDSFGCIHCSWLYMHLVGGGVGVRFNTVKPGPCRVIPGITCGSETIRVTEDGLAFITSEMRGYTKCNPQYLKGRIYLFDFNQPNENVTELNIKSESLKDFDPTGMDLIEENGIVKLFVMNHHPEASILVFEFDKKQRNELKHVKTIIDEKIVCPNSITLIDEKSFYFTNQGKYCRSHFFLVAAEVVLGLATSTLVYYNSGRTVVVVQNENWMNGVTLGEEQKRLYTVLTKAGELLEFDRLENNSLNLLKRYDIGFQPNNIIYDRSSNAFYVGTEKTHIYQFLTAMNLTEHSTAAGVKITKTG